MVSILDLSYSIITTSKLSTHSTDKENYCNTLGFYVLVVLLPLFGVRLAYLI